MKTTGRTHQLKTWPEPFVAIARGEKSWEFRYDDRGYRVGDVLLLREFVPHEGTYTGRVQAARITYILHAGFGLPPGHIIMSIQTHEREIDLGWAQAFFGVGLFLLGLALGSAVVLR